MKTNLDVPWVVFQGAIYRADHKLAPFTHDGKHHPDYHDGLVALAYTDEDKRAIAALPELIAALESILVNPSDESLNIYLARKSLAAVKGEPQP